ncbi:uncharacterized protein LOC105201305 [Solenopsis invicta]|uniref:uncharacterized protein LOC105201305 n=1 Tax=Solenopsis invicta TaxID=13686 RepID=UPI00193CB482|nr:uncharacterized protein LOC105201305 [Solenopsis invicta]
MPEDLAALKRQRTTLKDGAAKHLHALEALKRLTDKWDDILIYVLSSKFDNLTLREWQASLTGSELPTLKQFFTFITHHCQTLEATSKSSAHAAKSNSRPNQSGSQSKRRLSCAATVKLKCNYCQGEHLIYNCKDFLARSVAQRVSEVRGRKMCTNCLRPATHASGKCTAGCCKVCQARHNTLLHVSTPLKSSNDSATKGDDTQSAVSSTVLATHAISQRGSDHRVLSTAVVYAFDHEGSPKFCRALLDCGSQVNFVSRKFVESLSLRPRNLNLSISGANGATTTSSQVVRLRIQSRINSYTTVIDCVVADQGTDKVPIVPFKRKDFKFPPNIQLADPQFHTSSEIDLLIGVDIFWELLCVGQIRSSQFHPTLHKTRFGWVLGGRFNSVETISRVQSCHAAISNTTLHEQLNKFWQMEDNLAPSGNYMPEEAFCEQYFLANVTQNHEGRYIVKLPIKEHLLDSLKDSKANASQRFTSLEKRFNRDPSLKIEYSRFMQEYISLGHMRLADPQPQEEGVSFYLPHHCVFKGQDRSSKIRVVFDASCKSRNGLSLNDVLMVGPVVQQDLVTILIRFRTFRYVLVADIIKMYRQVLLDPSQTRLHRILWRDSSDTKINIYELTTVTYGTSTASFLVTRCLKHLAELHASKYPAGSVCVQRDFYVDDMLTGADSIQDIESIRDETIQLLRLGAFELSKWALNYPDLLTSRNDQNDVLVQISNQTESSELGVHWNRIEDTLHFSCKLESSCGVVSKRTILSEVSKLFDPLGLLGPSIVSAKLMLQELWQTGVDWDESVPQDIHTRGLPTFVANRVGEIQRLSDTSRWRHVPSLSNPADLISRGLYPRELIISDMWWHGPSFLQSSESSWPDSGFPQMEGDIPEQRKLAMPTVATDSSIVAELLNKFSNLNKICRIVVYCIRFNKTRRPTVSSRQISPLEASYSLGIICKNVQRHAFIQEYKALNKGKPISPTSSLFALSPFIDDSGVMRVGGRLKNAGWHPDVCHPILIPRHHILTRLVIEQAHARTLHAGTQATMAAVRQRFWPLALRSSTRKVIQGCVKCFRANPRQSEALMGSLPASRIRVSRPFSQCGVDYAGPFLLRESKKRNARLQKAYASIFVCFVTKAVHTELVSDLSSNAFIGAFKRFLSRRGKSSRMFSDNGTNFVGAQRQLKEFYEAYLKESIQSNLKEFFSSQEILWTFIPPNAPHFGGLWEAAVKAMKYHMTRIIGNAHLTYEEFQTVLCKIEAILNSRLITPLSADPNDHSKHERSKWRNNKGPQLQVNQLVLCKQPNAPPMQWPIGGVQEVHTGSDNVARTATVRTARGVLVRPLARLAILPLEEGLTTTNNS